MAIRWNETSSSGWQAWQCYCFVLCCVSVVLCCVVLC